MDKKVNDLDLDTQILNLKPWSMFNEISKSRICLIPNSYQLKFLEGQRLTFEHLCLFTLTSIPCHNRHHRHSHRDTKRYLLEDHCLRTIGYFTGNLYFTIHWPGVHHN